MAVEEHAVHNGGQMLARSGGSDSACKCAPRLPTLTSERVILAIRRARCSDGRTRLCARMDVGPSQSELQVSGGQGRRLQDRARRGLEQEGRSAQAQPCQRDGCARGNSDDNEVRPDQ
jgi:hypothetical protein